MIQKEDVINVAKSIRMDISNDHIDFVLRNYQSSVKEDELWYETIENILYSMPKQDLTEQHRPNPMDYDDSSEGDALYWDDYWGGDFDAMAYHDDIGDR